jgi:YfiH family protein
MVSGGAKLTALSVPQWSLIGGLVHGFLGRRGGVSDGVFAHLNLSSQVGDDPRAVEANWRLAAEEATGLPFVRMRQVHGTQVVRARPRMTAAGEADALLVTEPGIAASVLTADCVPILLVASRQRIAAAVHAGWRGTLEGIVDVTLAAFEREGGVKRSDVQAALGPAIGGCCYEVDAELADQLAYACGSPDGIVNRYPSRKAHVDLRRMNADRLRRAGLPGQSITTIGPCTCCASAEYFSHRGSGGSTGRQLSFIGWQS